VDGDEAPVTLQLTGRQKRLLRQMIEHYSEGVQEAITATTEDTSLEDIEDLLTLTGGYANALSDLAEMEKQLT
jgi:hypothetical protein